MQTSKHDPQFTTRVERKWWQKITQAVVESIAQKLLTPIDIVALFDRTIFHEVSLFAYYNLRANLCPANSDMLVDSCCARAVDDRRCSGCRFVLVAKCLQLSGWLL